MMRRCEWSPQFPFTSNGSLPIYPRYAGNWGVTPLIPRGGDARSYAPGLSAPFSDSQPTSGLGLNHQENLRAERFEHRLAHASGRESQPTAAPSEVCAMLLAKEAGPGKG